jgi:hypothetical protein
MLCASLKGTKEGTILKSGKHDSFPNFYEKDPTEKLI